MSRRGQLTRGDLPAWRLGEGLTTPYRKKSFYKVIHRVLDQRQALVNTVMNFRVP